MSDHARIRSLADHPRPYVTTSELAAYWMVSRKQIYKQIEAGTLKALRLGPRLLRVSTTEALRFEALAKMQPVNGHKSAELPEPAPQAQRRKRDDRASDSARPASAKRRVAIPVSHHQVAADGKRKRRRN